MTTTLTVTLLLLLLALVAATYWSLRSDRPRRAPRSHAEDPRFLPPVRWP